MVKSRLSRSLLILHPAVSVALASSAVFPRAGASNATTTTSFAETLCDGACSFFDSALTYSCSGVSSSSFSDFVPCGCISDSVTTWEGCSRCMILNADNGTQAALIMADDQKRFDDFQASCATAGQPIQDINLKNVPYIDSPVYFTYERPQSVSDKSFPDYITAVCQKPDRITLDQCWVGDTNWMYCPNSDVAGILVRVSTYMANLLLGIVLMYSPKEAATTVWAQLLTIYSLLASGIVAIAHGDLTRFHSEIIVMLVMSPLSSTLVVYAILHQEKPTLPIVNNCL
ncbi:hypothetical protein C8R43DRAFT_1136707 [Mycena crocata]|nr:hypothetical protein C8R43DRAFT_1136707 [Mycena crocata]